MPSIQHEPFNLSSSRCRVLLMIASMDGGGSERQTLILLRHLSREKFSPELFVLKRGGSLFSQIPSDVPIHSFEDSVKAARLNWPGKIHRQQVHYLEHLLTERRIDVVYDRTFHMTLIAGPAAKRIGVPRVSTIVSPPSHAVPLNGGRFIGLKRKQLSIAYADAGQTIAVSKPTARDARAYYGLKPHQIITVPNPVDSNEIANTVNAQCLPERDARYTVVCVGRMTIEKGHEVLINAVAELRDRYPRFPLPKVWLVGDGPLRKTLEDKTTKLGLGDTIQFTGHVNHPARWIAAADALCLPSKFEGFPNVMLEAMTLGIPVIASDIPVVRSLGSVSRDPKDRGRSYVAMFKCSDSIDLAKKIRRVRLNSTATRSRVSAARNLAIGAHAIETIVPSLEAIILRQLKPTPRRA